MEKSVRNENWANLKSVKKKEESNQCLCCYHNDLAVSETRIKVNDHHFWNSNDEEKRAKTNKPLLSKIFSALTPWARAISQIQARIAWTLSRPRGVLIVGQPCSLGTSRMRATFSSSNETSHFSGSQSTLASAVLSYTSVWPHACTVITVYRGAWDEKWKKNSRPCSAHVLPRHHYSQLKPGHIRQWPAEGSEPTWASRGKLGGRASFSRKESYRRFCQELFPRDAMTFESRRGPNPIEKKIWKPTPRKCAVNKQQPNESTYGDTGRQLKLHYIFQLHPLVHLHLH